MRSKRIDRILLSVGMILIFISSYQLFFQHQNKNAGPSLGKISSTTSVVKTKNALSLGWKDAFLGIEVAENQLLYTDSDSSAEVQLASGDEIKVGQNSLIRITSRKNITGVEVNRGILTARINSEQPLSFALNGEEYLLTSKQANVQINLQQGKGEIGVIGGTVTIDRNGERDILTSQTALIIEGKKVKKVKISHKLISPLPQAIFYTTEALAQVPFSWQPAGVAELELHQLDKVTSSISSVESGSNQSLPAGNYQWKVMSAEGSSITSYLKVIQEKSIQLIRPLRGEKLELLQNDSGSPVLLQWHGNQKQSIRLETQEDDQDVVSRVRKGTSALIPVARPGLFRWRIRIEDPLRPQALWSEWQEVEITLLPMPQTPTHLSPDEVEFQTFKSPGERIKLSWLSDSRVERELIGPDSKSSIVSSGQNKEELEITKEGSYRWRLRAIDAYNRKSLWSDWKSFTLTDFSGEVSQAGAQRILLKKPDQEVSFNWSAVPGTSSVFELALDRDFKQVISRLEVKADTAKIIVGKAGAYYWRSRQYLANGTITIGEPRRVIIEPSAAPAKPDKLPDVELPLEFKNVNQQTSFKLWHLFISPAFADDLQQMVRVTLPSNDNARKYVLRIFKRSDPSHPVLEKELSSNQFDWIGAGPGDYLWQYSYIDFWDRQSPFSDPASLTILASRPARPLLIRPIRAVEVYPDQLEFNWSQSTGTLSYQFEIARDANFKQVLISQNLKSTLNKVILPEAGSGLYFWRVRAKSKFGTETASNTGRFTLVKILKQYSPQVEPTKGWIKSFKNRISLAWSPSLDEYSFSDNNQSAEISGTALMGIEAKSNLFFSRWILNSEILRQSGKVFKSQDYLYQKLQIDPSWKLYLGKQLIGIGPALTFVSGQEYGIQNGIVKGRGVTSLSFGPVVRGFHSINSQWEVQSKLAYLMGSIKELEISADAIRHFSSFYALAGLGTIDRKYRETNAEQGSLKISFGLGKEF